MNKDFLETKSGVVECALSCGGTELPSSTIVLSADVEYRINGIPKATIVLLDGDMNEGKFELCEGKSLKPGMEVELKVGYSAKEKSTVFSGIIVRLGVCAFQKGKSCTKIECRHKAISLTKSRRNVNYLNKSDDDIVNEIASNSSITIESSMNGVTHKELLQYYCTDWDFIMTRAETNGCWLIPTLEKISIKPIEVNESNNITLIWKKNFLEFNATIDAEHQVKNVEARAWDPTKQEIISGKSAQQSIQQQGNINSKELSNALSVPDNILQINSCIEKQALDKWSKAEQIKNELSRVYGSIKCSGTSEIELGKLLNLDYVGNRFSGKAIVSNVSHHMELGRWTTTICFGMKKEWYVEKFNTMAPAASGYNCGITGLLTGVVIQTHDDPDNLNRVKVKIPLMQNEQEGVWARLGTPYASDGIGGLFFPEKDDEVILGFFNGDPSSPVILGSLYSSKRQVPQKLKQENNIKQLLTREKLSVLFDEEKKSITIMTPGERKVSLDDDGKKITLEDSSGNKIELSDSGIKIDSPKDITINTKGKFNVEAKGGIAFKSATNLNAEGLDIEFKAKNGFKAQGTTTAEVSASLNTIIKGGLVKIN
jgi:Rhs element Vgr protein